MENTTVSIFKIITSGTVVISPAVIFILMIIRKDTLIYKSIISDYHYYGNNPSLRVGDWPSDTSEAGVFTNTIITETSPGNRGAGTAYCGRIIYSLPESSHYKISTGIEKFAYGTGVRHVQNACLAYRTDFSEAAYCDNSAYYGECPLGWGSGYSLSNFEPGCVNGTYYPNPTPASNTNPFTGSCTIYLQRTSKRIVTFINGS